MKQITVYTITAHRGGIPHNICWHGYYWSKADAERQAKRLTKKAHKSHVTPESGLTYGTQCISFPFGVDIFLSITPPRWITWSVIAATYGFVAWMVLK